MRKKPKATGDAPRTTTTEAPKRERDPSVKVISLRVRDVVSDFLTRAAEESCKSITEYLIDTAIMKAEEDLNEQAPTFEAVGRKSSGVGAVAKALGISVKEFHKQAAADFAAKVLRERRAKDAAPIETGVEPADSFDHEDRADAASV